MRSPFCRKVALLTLFAAAGACVATWSPLTVGQEAKAVRKARGRLPAYYADIVSGEQREKIYAIQAKYREQISALSEQLAALEKKQTEDIEAVLTPEQLERLRQAQSDAVAKKKKSAAERKAAATAKAKSEE